MCGDWCSISEVELGDKAGIALILTVAKNKYADE